MQYENLYAPFDFSIKKNSEEITREQNEVKKRQDRYFRYNNSVKDESIIHTTMYLTTFLNRRLMMKIP